MSSEVSITILDDGPLKIEHAESLTYCGQDLDCTEELYLCRCGGSKNPPFCDGSHNKNGFSGDCESQGPAKIRKWEGRTLDTYFNTSTCMHVFYCKPLKELRAAELEGDDNAATEIIKVIGECPSGALSYELKEQCEVPEPTQHKIDIEVIEGGEIRIQKQFKINSKLNENQPENRATLCRCGESANKPWCDGKHRKKDGFK